MTTSTSKFSSIGIVFAAITVLAACGGGTSGGGGSTGLPDVQLGSGSASWAAPSTQEDGSPLQDSIDFYRLLVGTESGVYVDDFIIDAPNTGITVNNVPVGTYFAVVTAVDVQGRESQFSSEFTIVVN